MLAGGSDSAISPVVLAGYRNLGALATLRHGAEGASRPFDSERDGFVIGEGSGVLALEEREHALARGARIYAELAGYGSSCDASHLTDPDETGAGPGTAMTAALEDAGLGPEDIGYVSAHATSTPSGDAPRRARSSAPAWRTPPSRPPSRCTATRSAARAASRPPPRCCRSCAASCRRRSTWWSPTTAAASIT